MVSLADPLQAFFAHRFALFSAYIVFNFAATFAFVYLFTIVDWSSVKLFTRFKKAAPVEENA